jgi:MFS family permease
VRRQDGDAATYHLVRDSAWASVCGALFGGVVLAGYAIKAGAGPLAIGILAAIPYLVQALQLPATVVVEHYGRRKPLSVSLLTVARVIILLLALLPLRPVDAWTVPLLIAGKFGICALSAIAACALNSWVHQLLAGKPLGAFFSRRLLAGTVFSCACTLGVGWLLDDRAAEGAGAVYATAFALAGIAGLASSWHLGQCREPPMARAGPAVSMRTTLAAPFRDENFRALLVMLAAWNFAGNFASPFLTLYLVQQLGYGMGPVILMWVVGQACNALTLLSWGRVSDRLSNKAVLSVALPVFSAATLGLVFARAGAPFGLQLILLITLHAIMGIASGGIGLATGNLGLKLAPRGEGTAYLAAVGLVSSAAGGVAPLLAGILGKCLKSSQFSLVLRWTSTAARHEIAVLRITHLEFVFAVAAALGMYVMHAASRIREGTEVSERRVVQELMLEASRTVDQLSSVGGLLSSIFSFERLTERRMWFRHREEAADDGATDAESPRGGDRG